MGIENISTGYKPEFALGALYHGFNAGSADNASQLSNLIQEQALQKARIADPMDLIQKFYEAKLADAKTQSTDYIPAQIRGQIGQMNTQDAAGTLAQGLLQFRQKAGEAELTSEASKNRLFGNMYKGIEQQHDQSLPPDQREAAAQRGFFLADTLSRVDPKIMAQERMLGQKIDSAEEIAAMRLAAERERHQKQQNDPKYKEQLAAMFKVMADPNATPQQKYEAQMFITLDQQSKLYASGGGYKQDINMGQMGLPMNPAPVQQLTLPQPPNPAQQSGSTSSGNVIRLD